MYLLSYVHVCVTRTGWKTRPRPKTVILPIKKSNQRRYFILHFIKTQEVYDLPGPAAHSLMLSMVQMKLPGGSSSCGDNVLDIYTQGGNRSSFSLLTSVCSVNPLVPVVVMTDRFRVVYKKLASSDARFRLLFTFHKVWKWAGHSCLPPLSPCPLPPNRLGGKAHASSAGYPGIFHRSSHYNDLKKSIF